MTDNIVKFKDKKKLQKVLNDLQKCSLFVDMIIKEMLPHKIYNPIGDLLYQAQDSKQMLRIHIERVKKELNDEA